MTKSEIRNYIASNLEGLACTVRPDYVKVMNVRSRLGKLLTVLDEDMAKGEVAPGADPVLKLDPITAVTPDPITFYCPWNQRYDQARFFHDRPHEHPYMPGYFATGIEFRLTPDTDLKQHLSHWTAEVTLRFERLTWLSGFQARFSEGPHDDHS